MPGLPQSACSQAERVGRSLRANALDGLLVAIGVLAALWPVGYAAGVLQHAPAVQGWAERFLQAVMLWAIFGSPLWHGDSLESRGLGRPSTFLSLLRNASGAKRWVPLVVACAVFSGLLRLGFTDWPLTARFLHLPQFAKHWPATPFGWAAMTLFCVAVAATVATSAIRYDNSGPAFSRAGLVCMAFLAYAAAAAWCWRGNAAFAALRMDRLPLEIAGYSFWGFLQQLIFTAFFATRMRQAFCGATNESISAEMPRMNWLTLMRAACCGALGVGLLVWLTLRRLHGSEASVRLLIGCVLFAAPAAAVVACAYQRQPLRTKVALLSGSFFGIIHANSYGLVIATTALGSAFAYLAMEDRFRNLAAFAVVHGVLGTVFGKLFRDAGILKVDFRVGPWNIKQPYPEALAIPMLYLFLYGCLTLWAWRRLSNASLANPLELQPCANSQLVQPAVCSSHERASN